MDIKQAVKTVLDQLSKVVEQIHEDDFVKPIEVLSQSTLGQHVRHTLEFFICLTDGYKQGFVNYDKRNHDQTMESDKSIALSVISRIEQFIIQGGADKSFILESSYDPDSDSCEQVKTTYYRELVYNIEHAIHHMAILKIGIKETCPYVTLPLGFGIAVSTIKYQQSKAKESPIR